MTDPATSETQTGDVRVVARKYELHHVLGKGGVGIVYEAENTWTGRRVALKVLASEGKDPERVRRFLLEGRAATSLAHPNIVDVLDMGQDPEDGSLFIVQELLEGGSLADRLTRDGPLSVEETVALMAPLLRALAFAHDRGFLHRDLKPSNIMLARGADGAITPKLIDFGLAKVFQGEVPTEETRSGAIMGTPRYMSPEQLRGERPLDARTDVWSMGAVLYEVLSGRPPFVATNYNLLVHEVLSRPPTPLTEHAPSVPARVAAVVQRALHPERAERYPSSLALLDALVESAQEPARAPEAPPSPTEAPPAPEALKGSTPTEAPSTPVEPPRARSEPRRSLALGLVVALVALGSFAVVTFAPARPPLHAPRSALPRAPSSAPPSPLGDASVAARPPEAPPTREPATTPEAPGREGPSTLVDDPSLHERAGHARPSRPPRGGRAHGSEARTQQGTTSLQGQSAETPSLPRPRATLLEPGGSYPSP